MVRVRVAPVVLQHVAFQQGVPVLGHKHQPIDPFPNAHAQRSPSFDVNRRGRGQRCRVGGVGGAAIGGRGSIVEGRAAFSFLQMCLGRKVLGRLVLGRLVLGTVETDFC